MNINTLQTLYVNNIENIFKPESFKELASHSNNIQGYSFMNRALIYMQNKFSTDVKSELSWQFEGRAVNDRAVPMGIITPVVKTTYIDKSTGLPVSVGELTPDEFNKAISLGIVEKNVEVTDIRSTSVYDINDTYVVDSTKESKILRKLKLSTLYELLSSMGIVVERSDEVGTTLDINSWTLKIGSDSVESRLSKSLEALVLCYLQHINADVDFSDEEKGLLVKYAIYVVCTYFNIDNSVEFEGVHEIYEQRVESGKLESLIDTLDEIEHILNSTVLNSGNPSGYALDEGHKAYIAHKATILLSILEANYEARGLEGV